jgi:ATP-dependent Clp protease ATP-binding subunit ClpA
MEKFAISPLIHSGPGYVSREDGRQLTETIRRRSVEKA